MKPTKVYSRICFHEHTFCEGISKGIAHLHNMRNPILHGDFKPSDVLIPAKTLQPKITNFGLWDFKNFFLENVHQGIADLIFQKVVIKVFFFISEDVLFFNPCQAPEVLVYQVWMFYFEVNSKVISNFFRRDPPYFPTSGQQVLSSSNGWLNIHLGIFKSFVQDTDIEKIDNI